MPEILQFPDPKRLHRWYTQAPTLYQVFYADNGAYMTTYEPPRSPWPRPKKTEAQLWQEDYEAALQSLESDF